MTDFLAAILLLVGSIFMLLAAVGVVRMPDLYLRMQTATKAATLGLASLALALALALGDVESALTALTLVVFFFLTAPVAAHMIGRAAYRSGVPLWEATRHDDLASAEGPSPGNQARELRDAGAS